MNNEKLTAERLFERYFAPHYPESALGELDKVRATDANPGQNPAIFAQIDEAARVFARLAPRELGAPELALDFSDASVHRLGVLLTRERRDALTAPRGKGEPPMLVTLVTHGALYIGACVVKNHGATWLVRNPLWESMVRLSSHAGTADLCIFPWWLKAFSDDEIDEARLGDRYRTHVEVPTFDPTVLAPIAPPDRRLPRLARVRYDLLYKHLRAHLPELRDLGADFPSAERFEELGFKWLDFALLGEGKMLLLHGQSEHGAHFFWLDKGGFVKSAYYPSDPFPEHQIKMDGDKLRIFVSMQGKMQVHEMLWWGL